MVSLSTRRTSTKTGHKTAGDVANTTIDWSVIRKMSTNPKKADHHNNITTGQVTHKYFQNGKTSHGQRQTKLKRADHENHHFDNGFIDNELRNSLINSRMVMLLDMVKS